MMISKSVLSALFAFSLTASGDILEYQFNPQATAGWKMPETVSVVNIDGEETLRFDVKQGTRNSDVVIIPFDLKPFYGKELLFSCETKSEHLTAPKNIWLGGKFMLHFISDKQQFWPQARQLWGNYDWSLTVFRAKIPVGSTGGELIVGVQESTGVFYIRNIKVQEFDITTVFPKANLPENFKCRYTDRVKKQSPLRGAMSPAGYRKGDLEELAKWNANLLRRQIIRGWGDNEINKDPVEYLQWIDSTIVQLRQQLDDAEKLGIALIIDLHTPPGGKTIYGDMAIYHDPQYLECFQESWRRIATACKGHPALWGYDIVNEPMQTVITGKTYMDVYAETAEIIRSIDPETPIIIGANEASIASAFRYFIPLDMENIIYQVHMYTPGSYTHQYIGFDFVNDKNINLKPYPGRFDGEDFDAGLLRKYLQPVRDFQLKYGARIYCGEFAAVRWAPGAEQYMEDLIKIFEEYGWDWSYHVFREWNGMSVEHSEDPTVMEPVAKDTGRKKMLLRYFKRNKPFRFSGEKSNHFLP